MRRPPSSILTDLLEIYTRYSVPGARTFLSHLRNKNVATVLFDGTKWRVQFVKPSREANVFESSEFDSEFIMALAEELTRAGAMRRGSHDVKRAAENPFYVARLPNLDTLILSENSLQWKSWAYPIPTLDTLQSIGTLTSELNEFFRVAVASKRTIIVAGASGTGKTTLLNALARRAYECRPTEILLLDEKATEIYLPPEACVCRATIIELDRLHAWGGGLIATQIDGLSFKPATEVASRCDNWALLETTSASDVVEVLEHLRCHYSAALNHTIDYVVMMAQGGPLGSNIYSVSSVWQVRLDWECKRLNFRTINGQ